MNLLQKFFLGFSFVREGFRAVKGSRALKLLIVIPFVIDLILLGTGIYFGTDQVQIWTQKAILFLLGAGESTWHTVLYYPLLILFWLVFVVLYFYVVAILASVLASPFYSVIAEKTLALLGKNADEKVPFLTTLKRSAVMFWVSIVRGLLLLTLGLFLFVASFLPGLNLFVAFFAFVILAFDSTDYAFEAKNFTLTDRLRFFRQHFVVYCGMGAFVALTAFLPGLILLVMPFAVVGATLVVSRLHELKD
jgi:CysZ protein